MYSRLTYFFVLPLALTMVVTTAIGQTPPQTPAAPAPATAGQATVRGRITDPSGALIPGTVITISNRNGQTVATATADESGNYEVHTPAGTYSVTATTPGFAPFVSQGIPLAAGQVKRIDISMAIETAQQSVTVTDESPTVSVDADSNSNSMVIKGKDLEALSDDPDELSSELSALAGPSAGPNGGQIYIDGFTGGQLPPKSSIREIRVNQNPYSAEFDRLGFGRIEILTKPGTDKLHGQFMIQGNDSAFNTGDPFTKSIPPYYSYQYNGTLNGSLNKNTSFFVSAEHRSINNEIVYDTACDESGNCPVNGISGTIFNPHSRTNVSPRFDFQFGAKNTLTLRYQYFHDSEQGDINATDLPTQSFTTTTNDNSIQASDTEIINDRIVNETRFSYDRSHNITSPVNTSPTLQVSGQFTGGGNSQQNVQDHTDRFEFQNLTTMSLGRHALKFGTRLRDGRDANAADSGFNGSFTFGTPGDYSTALKTPNAATPEQLTYSTGPQSATGNVFDAALFVQDDWKFSPRLTLSGGLRWETQNHVADHSDWAPRISMAWAVDGGKNKQAKTVLRAGYGLFYDRLQTGNFLTINRSQIEQQYVLNFTYDPAATNNPGTTCFQNSLTQLDLTACGTGTSVGKTTYQVAPGYRSPYTQQFGASIERQVTKTTTATVTYLHSQGVHQLVEINANAPYFPSYNSAAGNLYQYLPEGIFKQDQMIVNANARISPKFNVFGFYTLSFAHSDGAGGSIASNSANLAQDHGPAGFVSRNQVFMIGNYTGPWGIRLNPFLIAQSGRPFNITVRNDLNGDSFLNDRPHIASAALCVPDSTVYKQTKYGCLDTSATPAANEPLIANNAGNGPAAVAVNLRISRAFGIGPKLKAVDPNANAGGGPPGGGPPGGGRGGPGGPGGGPGGGFGPGGFGGGGGRGGPGGMFGPTNTGRKFNLNFSVQALNVFNNIDRGTPIGTVIPPGLLAAGTKDTFGTSPSLQRGIFSQGSAARRIFFQAVFSF